MNITVITISLLFLFGGNKPNIDTASSVEVSRLQNDVNEANYWSDKPLTQRQVKAEIFARSTSDTEHEVLAIIPDLNATYLYKRCGKSLLLVDSDEEWLLWNIQNERPIPSDTYEQKETKKYASLISASDKFVATIHIDPEGPSLFKIDSKEKRSRLKDIQEAAANLFQERPLDIRVAPFSENTSQINAIIPSRSDFVTFSLVRHTCGDGTVQVGRVLPLKAIRPLLREKIEKRGSAININ
jgi:hypothetical protein